MMAVTFALPAESSAFVRRLENVKRNAAILRGDLPAQSNISVLHTGVGARECERRLHPFLHNQKLRILISSGFCGGTSEEAAPGTLVIGANYSDRKLARKAQEVLTTAKMGTLFSPNRIVDRAEDRYALGREERAIALDMETETIARMAAAEGVAMLSLRVVSDSPAAPFPAPPEVLFDIEGQRTNFLRLLGHVARDPAAAVRLVRFSHQVALARIALADALCAMIAAL